jgi:hypothetical protein
MCSKIHALLGRRAPAFAPASGRTLIKSKTSWTAFSQYRSSCRLFIVLNETYFELPIFIMDSLNLPRFSAIEDVVNKFLCAIPRPFQVIVGQ